MKKIIALILALLMAAAVIPAYAKPAAEDTAATYDMAAEDISAYGEAIRYPLDNYQLQPTLGQAAGCEGDRFFLDFVNADPNQPWSLYFDMDSDYRWIAHAYVPAGGTFDSEMTASYRAMAGTQAFTFDYWLGTDSDARMEVKVTVDGVTTVVFTMNGEGLGAEPEWKQGICAFDVAEDDTTVTVSVGYMGTVAYGKGETKDSSYGDPSKNLYLRNFYVQRGMDGALNAPDFFAHYTYSNVEDFMVFPDSEWGRVALAFMPNEEERYERVTALISVNAGATLSFDIFTMHTNAETATRYSFYVGEDAAVSVANRVWTDAGYNTGTYNHFETVSYTFVNKGNYYISWYIGGASAGNYAFVDNVRVTNPLTIEKAATMGEGYGEYDINKQYFPTEYATTWYNGFIPFYYTGLGYNLPCVKSNSAGANNTTANMTTTNMQKAGDVISFGYLVSSESNYDWFNFYINGVQQIHVSGESGLKDFSYTIPADGVYTYLWQFKKDVSLANGDDCVYLYNIVIPQMSYAHAVGLDTHGGSLSDLWTWSGSEWEIMMKDGEYVLASTNYGFANSQSVLYSGLQPDETLCFEYIKDGETNYDNFYVCTDDVNDDGALVITARNTDWQQASYRTGLDYNSLIMMIYEKDGSVNVGTDRTYLRNMRIETDLDRALNIPGGTLHFTNIDYLEFEPYQESAEHYCARCVATGEDNAQINLDVDNLQPGDVIVFDYKVTGSSDAGITLFTGGWGAQWSGSGNGYWDRCVYTFTSANDNSIQWCFWGEDGDVCYIDNVLYIPQAADELDKALNVEGGTLHFENVEVEQFHAYMESEEHYAARCVATGEYGGELSLDVANLKVGDTISFDYKTVGGEGIMIFTGGWGAQWTGGATNGEWRHVDYTLTEVNDESIQWSFWGELGDICYIDNIVFTPAAGTLLGDVDGDGQLTFTDITTLSLYLSGEGEIEPQFLPNADVNGDGEITYLDLTELALMLIG